MDKFAEEPGNDDSKSDTHYRNQNASIPDGQSEDEELPPLVPFEKTIRICTKMVEICGERDWTPLEVGQKLLNVYRRMAKDLTELQCLDKIGESCGDMDTLVWRLLDEVEKKRRAKIIAQVVNELDEAKCERMIALTRTNEWASPGERVAEMMMDWSLDRLKRTMAVEEHLLEEIGNMFQQIYKQGNPEPPLNSLPKDLNGIELTEQREELAGPHVHEFDLMETYRVMKSSLRYKDRELGPEAFNILRKDCPEANIRYAAANPQYMEDILIKALARAIFKKEDVVARRHFLEKLWPVVNWVTGTNISNEIMDEIRRLPTLELKNLMEEKSAFGAAIVDIKQGILYRKSLFRQYRVEDYANTHPQARQAIRLAARIHNIDLDLNSLTFELPPLNREQILNRFREEVKIACARAYIRRKDPYDTYYSFSKAIALNTYRDLQCQLLNEMS